MSPPEAPASVESETDAGAEERTVKASKEKQSSEKHRRQDAGALDIFVPENLVIGQQQQQQNGSRGECTLLVQIDPDQVAGNDLTGATGAIGRIEADDRRGTEV
jgi:hypothetical protein